ncbi:hypothetical protein KAU33_00500 [Candidatus Dependentiae bacterium]|nr:hypothetical protein [Candidatus Dependentiae bacterium]
MKRAKFITTIFLLLLMFSVTIYGEQISFDTEYQILTNLRDFIYTKLKSGEDELEKINTEHVHLEKKSKAIIKKIELKKEEYFSETNKREKKRIKKHLTELLNNLIENNLELKKNEHVRNIKVEEFKDFGRVQNNILLENKNKVSKSELLEKEKSELLTEYKRIIREINRVVFKQKYVNELFLQKLEQMRLNNRKIKFLTPFVTNLTLQKNKMEEIVKNKKSVIYRIELARIDSEIEIFNSEVQKFALKNKHIYDSIILKESKIYFTNLILIRIENEYIFSKKYISEEDIFDMESL